MNLFYLNVLISCCTHYTPGNFGGFDVCIFLCTFYILHDGSLSTGHANSTQDMLNRLETLVLMGMDIPLLAVRNQIASAIDIVVQLGRLRDKSRKVLEIAEVTGVKNDEIMVQPIYKFVETGTDAQGKIKGELRATGSKLLNKDKLAHAGLLDGFIL